MAWDIFSEVCQQWRLSPTGGIIGLDLAAVLPYLQVINDDKTLQRCYWRDLCHITSGVIQAQQDNHRE